MKLTEAQAEAIMDTWDSFGFRPFHPTEVYPARDNRDNGGRRSLNALARKGLLEKVEILPGDSRPHQIANGQCFRYKLIETAMDLLRNYRKEHDLPGW